MKTFICRNDKQKVEKESAKEKKITKPFNNYKKTDGKNTYRIDAHV